MTPAAGSPEIVEFAAGDATLVGDLHRARGAGRGGGVVLVHAAHHERDAYTYGHPLPDELASRGMTAMTFDLRGRGASRGARPPGRLTPVEKRRGVHDVAAALATIADEVDAESDEAARLALVGEQDLAGAALGAAAGDERVRAVVLLSPRVTPSALAVFERRPVPTLVIVSAEDRRALADSVAVHLAAPAHGSRLDIVEGLGFGTTMFAARAFEQPDDEPIETIIATWLAERLEVTAAS